MPYNVRQSGSAYVVVDDNGKVVGSHDTKEEAERHQRALYANVPDAKAEQPTRNNWNGYFFPRNN